MICPIPEECTPAGYGSAGLKVFPLRGKDPDGTQAPHGHLDAAVATDRFTWEGRNVGLPMVSNGLVGFDEDDAAAGAEVLEIIRRYPTATARTARGHHYVYATSERFANTHLPGFDIRSGGYIAVEPSVHPDTGAAYEWETREIAPLPDELRGLLRPAGESAPAASAAEVSAFLDEHTAQPDGWELPLLDRCQWAESLLENGDGRNNTVIRVLPNMFRDAAAGMYPAAEAVDRLRDKVLAAPGDDDFSAEFEGLVPRAVGMARATAYDDVLDATPTLSHIRQAAHSRMVSAPALLLYVLARVLAEVPPEVKLPPVIGAPAALNLGVTVAGPSGAGKTAIVETSRGVLGDESQRHIEVPVGSGEGMAQAFLKYDTHLKENVLVEYPHRIILVDEIDSLGATQNRSGATLAPTLRSALTGSTVGQQNADAQRRRIVPGGVYRLVLLAGVQPTRAGVLLDDADAGTPQRFVWVRATDPTIPSPVEPEAWPGALNWSVMDVPLPDGDEPYLDYPEHIKAEVRRARYDVQTGNTDDTLKNHLMLTRLKVGAALALLHGEAYISKRWWVLAGRIVDESMQVQGECRAVLSAEAERHSRTAGKRKALQDEGAAAHRDERVVKAAQSIYRKVLNHSTAEKNGNDQKHEPGEGCTSRCISRGVRNYPDRQELREPALDHAEVSDWVERGSEDRWFPGTSQPT